LENSVAPMPAIAVVIFGLIGAARSGPCR